MSLGSHGIIFCNHYHIQITKENYCKRYEIFVFEGVVGVLLPFDQEDIDFGYITSIVNLFSCIRVTNISWDLYGLVMIQGFSPL